MELPSEADFAAGWRPGQLRRLLVLERLQDPGNLVRALGKEGTVGQGKRGKGLWGGDAQWSKGDKGKSGEASWTHKCDSRGRMFARPAFLLLLLCASVIN